MSNRTALVALSLAAAIGLGFQSWSPAKPEASLADLLAHVTHGRSSQEAIASGHGIFASNAAFQTVAEHEDHVLTPPPHPHARNRAGS